MEVNIDRLIGLKMTIEEYTVLFLLYNEEKDSLSSYIKNVAEISHKTFLDLVNKGYITSNTSEVDTIDNIELTDKFKFEVLKLPNTTNITFEEAFNQLRAHYPSKVNDPNGSIRRLHADVERSKRLYKGVISPNGIIDEDKHKLILQCIDFEVSERTRGRNLQYMQMLVTYISKKSWELVREDTEKLIKKNGSVDASNALGEDNIDAI